MTTSAIDKADLVIRGARLIDGTGGPSATGDLAVLDDRIAAMGDLAQVKGAVEIAGAGLALAPGFIDVHTHDDRALLVNPENTLPVALDELMSLAKQLAAEYEESTSLTERINAVAG